MVSGAFLLYALIMSLVMSVARRYQFSFRTKEIPSLKAFTYPYQYRTSNQFTLFYQFIHMLLNCLTSYSKVSTKITDSMTAVWLINDFTNIFMISTFAGLNAFIKTSLFSFHKIYNDIVSMVVPSISVSAFFQVSSEKVPQIVYLCIDKSDVKD